MANGSSSTLSRGRTRISRRHVNIGNIVHEAGDAIEYIHLSVLKGASLDEDVPDVVVVNENGVENNVQLRVVIGENADALFFNISRNVRGELRLADNLCVHPYEQVYVSTSDPDARLIVNGVVTRKPVLR